MAKLTRTWLLLVALTLGALIAGRATAAGSLGLPAAAVLMLVSALKANLILTDFLGLARSSPGWRVLLRGYLAVLALLIVAAYAMTSAGADG